MPAHSVWQTCGAMEVPVKGTERAVYHCSGDVVRRQLLARSRRINSRDDTRLRQLDELFKQLLVQRWFDAI